MQLVPANTMLTRSPKGAFLVTITSLCFSTERDSPVSKASSAFKFIFLMRRASAGKRSPVEIIIISPGTRSRAKISVSNPLRKTSAVGEASFDNTSSARLARSSWINPRMTENNIITPMVIASTMCPKIPENTAAAKRIIMREFLNWLKKSSIGKIRAEATSWFGPYFKSRSRAWSLDNPKVALVLSLSITSETERECQGKSSSDGVFDFLWISFFSIYEIIPKKRRKSDYLVLRANFSTKDYGLRFIKFYFNLLGDI